MKKPVSKATRTRVTHEFPALYDRESRVLLLGSIPSPKSREMAFYYGHPQNRFWKVMATVLGESVPETIAQKKAMLKNITWHCGMFWTAVLLWAQATQASKTPFQTT